jgi:hypothetical protein
MQISVGSRVTVVVENLSKRHVWDSDTVQFDGTVIKNLRGVGDDQMCLTTGDPLFPVRIIRKSRILSMNQGGVTQVITHTDAPVVKTGVWQITGSKGDAYTVTRNGDRWSCDCKAMQFGRNTCKHIKSIQASV